jgi:NitT/TauT family transport system substrate-binding protein
MKARALLLALALVGIAPHASGSTVRVLLPDRDNLQYMAFWVAEGARYFEDEGIEIALSIPSAPAQTLDFVKRNDSDVAVLPPPMYLELIGGRFPILLVANLLRNDPIDLVVRKSVLEERGVTPDMPIGERLRRLTGLRVGVAPHPPPRLRALYKAYGMDADQDIAMVILRGPEQNYAFGNNEVDALYAHTPYLETALVEQGAELVVNQSAGEVSALAARQIHALVVTRSFAERYPNTVLRMTRAIARAEELIHKDTAAATLAVLSVFPTLDRTKVERIVRIYAPAVPDTPRVSVLGIPQALAFYPSNKSPPDLTGIDLEAYVDDRFAADASAPRPTRRVLAVAGVVTLAVAAAFLTLRRAGRRKAGAAA